MPNPAQSRKANKKTVTFKKAWAESAVLSIAEVGWPRLGTTCSWQLHAGAHNFSCPSDKKKHKSFFKLVHASRLQYCIYFPPKLHTSPAPAGQVLVPAHGDLAMETITPEEATQALKRLVGGVGTGESLPFVGLMGSRHDITQKAVRSSPLIERSAGDKLRERCGAPETSGFVVRTLLCWYMGLAYSRIYKYLYLYIYNIFLFIYVQFHIKAHWSLQTLTEQQISHEPHMCPAEKPRGSANVSW